MYREISEREEYIHSILWKEVEFFLLLSSSLITIAVSLYQFNIYALAPILFLVSILNYVGRYVIISESKYFHEQRYKFLVIRKKIGYYDMEEMKSSPEYKDINLNFKAYIDKNVNSESGVRYTFRLLFFILTILCWVIFSLLNPFHFDCLIYIVIVVFSFVIIILIYLWEVKSLIKKIYVTHFAREKKNSQIFANSMKKNELATHQPRNPDSLFDIAVVVLAILSAGGLAYYLGNPGKTPPINILRVFTYPFIVLFGLWLVNEFLIKNLNYRLSIVLRDFCWALWSNLLFFNLLSVMGSTIFLAISVFILSALLFSSIMLGYSHYARVNDKENYIHYFRSYSWLSEKIIIYCLGYFMVYFIVTNFLF